MNSISRRFLFQRTGLGLGAMSLSALLGNQTAIGAPQTNPLLPRQPMFAPRAKRIIYLHMIGAPSQLDLFDHKPELITRDGQECPESLLKGRRFAFIGNKMTLSGTKWKFSRHGQSGQEMSELLPNLAKIADDIAILKTLHTEEINHARAYLEKHIAGI